MSKKRDKPQIEYLVSLHKLKDAYFKYNLDSYEDLESLISYHQNKLSYSDGDLIRIEVKCEREWGRLLINICEGIIKKIERSKKKEKIYSKELKEAKLMLQKIRNNEQKLGEYEKIFSEEIEPLKQDFDGKLEKEETEWKRFWLGLLIGFVIGLFGVFIFDWIKSLF